MSKLVVPASARDHIRGPHDAPITLVVYGDYECPYTNEAYYVLRQIFADAPQRVRFAFRNFPLTQIHPHSLPAALAAEAADQQGVFWQMYDLLFEHSDQLTPEYLVAYGQLLGLDLERFIADMTSDETAERVREDFMSGIRSGVNGTPTFFLNGRRYDDSYDYETLMDAIQRAPKGRKSHDKTDPPKDRHSRASV